MFHRRKLYFEYEFAYFPLNLLGTGYKYNLYDLKFDPYVVGEPLYNALNFFLILQDLGIAPDSTLVDAPCNNFSKLMMFL